MSNYLKMQNIKLIYKQSSMRSYYYNYGNNSIDRFEYGRKVGTYTIYTINSQIKLSAPPGISDYQIRINKQYLFALNKIKKCLLRLKIIK